MSRPPGGRRAAVRWAFALFAVTPLSAAAQTTDTITVRVGPEGALVTQRLEPIGGEVRAVAIRIEGQLLDVREVVREGESLLDAVLEPGRAAYGFHVESGAPVVLEYFVSGATERIPFFVASGEAELTVAEGAETPYMIRIEGEPGRLDAIDAGTSLPRFRRTADGALEVAVSSVPSFARLPEAGGLSFTRLADLVAVSLILLGALWAWRVLARNRAG